MRFKKGSRVEVLCKKELPSGVWRCGEIISGNGHTYSVRFEGPPVMGGCQDNVERVTRKAIRPCPPPVDGPDCWTAGDVVEVFDDFCWKAAAVLKVMRRNYYLVRLLGSSTELQINKVHTRLRQLWQDGNWVVIGKGSGSCDKIRSNKLSTLKNDARMSSSIPQAEARTKVLGETSLAVENNTGFQESYMLSARTLKRASSVAESCNGQGKKMRAIEKNGERPRVMHSSLVSKKVDAAAYAQAFLGEKCMHAPPDNQKELGYYASGRKQINYFVQDFHARSSEPNDCEIDACSVGSCSVISVSPCKLSSHFLGGNSPDADTLSSDAESYNHCGDDEERCSLPLGEDVAARIHRLELHAYRCTLDALYASGPLTWEQEALLTNLRISLNISNDEHLLELRHLISAGTSMQKIS